jgi:two-component system, OmpR family, KDP operon response regulator KdpE
MIETKTAALTSQILIVEDDPQIRRFLRTALSAEHYVVHEASTAAQGWIETSSQQPDLVLLDLGLPDGDGIEVIRQVREWNLEIPIIVISVRGREQDKINALDAGADDFVTKPFSAGELLARVRAALRRSATTATGSQSALTRVGTIEVDFEKRLVRVSNNEVHLTRIEYKLLQIMLRHPDKVLTHRQLLNMVWGPHHVDQTHYLRVYMGQLRRKLEADPARPKHIRTEPGVGYRLVTG